MKVIFIVALSTIISISGIYILREKIFKVNDQAPDEDLLGNKSFSELSLIENFAALLILKNLVFNEELRELSQNILL